MKLLVSYGLRGRLAYVLVLVSILMIAIFRHIPAPMLGAVAVLLVIFGLLTEVLVPNLIRRVTAVAGSLTEMEADPTTKVARAYSQHRATVLSADVRQLEDSEFEFAAGRFASEEIGTFR